MEAERVAHIHGWDFSHIEGKFDEEKELPWDYESIVKHYLKPDHDLLDIEKQEKLDQKGVIEGTIHRFLLVAKK